LLYHMLHLKAKMHQIRLLAFVRLSLSVCSRLRLKTHPVCLQPYRCSLTLSGSTDSIIHRSALSPKQFWKSTSLTQPWKKKLVVFCVFCCCCC